MWFISLDTETTGLDHDIHEVIELKARALTRTLEQVGTFYTKIKPLNIASASEEALKINQYSPEQWEDAPEPAQAYEVFRVWLEEMKTQIPYLSEYKNKHPICLGQNVSFDQGFIQANATRAGVKIPFSYHKLDLVGVSIFMDLASSIMPDFKWRESYSLSKVASSLGINTGIEHTAAADEETHMQLLKLYLEKVRNGLCPSNAPKC